MVQDMGSISYSNVRYVYNLLPLNSMHELSPIGVRADIRAHAGTKCDLGRVDALALTSLCGTLWRLYLFTMKCAHNPD
jgi:hypothetical protein